MWGPEHPLGVCWWPDNGHRHTMGALNQKMPKTNQQLGCLEVCKHP